MTRIVGAVVVVVLLGAGFTLAQTPKTPQLTELERALVQIVQLSDQLAICRQQLGAKGVQDASAQVRARVEAAYPGYTIDWQTGQLVAKPK